MLEYVPEGGMICEVGVLRARYSMSLLNRMPKELHLVDPYKYFGETTKEDYNSTSKSSQAEWDETFRYVVNKFIGTPSVSLIRMESREASRLYKDETFDLVYIDANHAYEAVKEDVRLWMPKVKKGGILAGHDIEMKSVFNALKDTFGFHERHEDLVKGGRIFVTQLGHLSITTEYDHSTKKMFPKSWFFKVK